MQATDEERRIYGSRLEVAERGAARTVYRIAYDDGFGEMTTYRVFPGIDLLYNDFATQSCYQNMQPVPGLLEINHCRAGRFECEFTRNRFVYMGEGDMAVNLLTNQALSSSFPLGVYRGIALMVELRRAEEALAALPKDMRPDFANLAARLELDTRPFVLRASPQVEHVFGELYTLCPQTQTGYLKLKILELFFFLGMLRPQETEEKRRYYARCQVRAVKDIHAELTAHPERRFTLPALAEAHGVGTTLLKTCFRDIYGSPLFTWLREYRMQRAAELLRATDESVAAVAGRVGYENPGKFAAAFRACMGQSPLAYRKSPRPLGAENVRAE